MSATLTRCNAIELHDSDSQENESTTNNMSLESQSISYQNTETISNPKIRKRRNKKQTLSPQNSITFYQLSALYGKILVVIGLVFPTAEAIVPEKISYIYHVAFYMFLYLGSVIFLGYAHFFLIQSSIPNNVVNKRKENLIFWIFSTIKVSSENTITSDQTDKKILDLHVLDDLEISNSRARMDSRQYGSMYLKMGAVLFGMGNMIYSGLEVGQWIELMSDQKCKSPLQVLLPVTSMVFAFAQMYFIFLTSKIAIKCNVIYVQFGLMHVLGTNLCNWLRILVKETKHDIDDITSNHMEEQIQRNILNSTETVTNFYSYEDDNITKIQEESEQISNLNHMNTNRFIDQNGYIQSYECRHSHIMGSIIDNSSPFLFPCTIEFSLLCSAVLYIIWKSTLNQETEYGTSANKIAHHSEEQKTFHHYSVDCTSSGHGLFLGIILVVFTIISLIVFFVFISNDNDTFKKFAILEAEVMEFILYGVASLATVVSMIQMRQLKAVPKSNMELDNILLLVASIAIYLYAIFTFISSLFQNEAVINALISPLTTAVAQFIQTCLQTLLILDASHRCCVNRDQVTRKPGRQLITFLLLCNLDLWAMNTFETSRADAHPVQLEFYGAFTWAIISHATMPLVIFYRFHCTVCLCDIWKRTYKLNNAQ